MKENAEDVSRMRGSIWMKLKIMLCCALDPAHLIIAEGTWRRSQGLAKP